jgi:hypothetical protein
LNFPDDDCVLLPDTLRLAQELLDSMNLQLLTGMSVDDFGRESTTAFIRDERFLTPWNMWGRRIEFTAFFDWEAFLRVGGYDERFGVGSRYDADEGAEFLIRLLLTLRPKWAYYSHRVRFVPPDKQNDFSATGAERAFNYARGRGAKVREQLSRGETGLAEFHCMLVRTDLFAKLGRLDEAFLNTKEHVDFSMAARQSGERIFFEPPR